MSMMQKSNSNSDASLMATAVKGIRYSVLTGVHVNDIKYTIRT